LIDRAAAVVPAILEEQALGWGTRWLQARSLQGIVRHGRRYARRQACHKVGSSCLAPRSSPTHARASCQFCCADGNESHLPSMFRMCAEPSHLMTPSLIYRAIVAQCCCTSKLQGGADHAIADAADPQRGQPSREDRQVCCALLATFRLAMLHASNAWLDTIC
jgi:hypothetical protein